MTTLSNLLRMLYSRAGDYPPGQALLYAESFSPNTPEGACPTCHGLGRVYDVTEKTMVPDDTQDDPRAGDRRMAAGMAWTESARHRDDAGLRHRQALARTTQERSRLAAVYRRAAASPGVCGVETAMKCARAIKRKEPPSYMGTFTGARKYVLQTFATTAKPADEKAGGAVHGERRMLHAVTASGCVLKHCG